LPRYTLLFVWGSRRVPGDVRTVANFADFRLLPDPFCRAQSLETHRALVVLIAVPYRALARRGTVASSPPNLGVLRILMVFAALLLAALLYAPGSSYETINAVTPDEEWSDTAHGYALGPPLYRANAEAREAVFRKGSMILPACAITVVPRKSTPKQHRIGATCHIVVLESFIDVRRLRRVRFSDPPMAPSFTAWATRISARPSRPRFAARQRVPNSNCSVVYPP